MENVVADAGFWKGRRVFITGHTGFKGAWLAILLKELGADIHGYALDPLPGSLFFQGAVSNLLTSSTIADVRDLSALRDAVERVDPEIVFHLAAQPLVRWSYETPVETFAANVMGTVHLLEAVRSRPSIRAVVIVTSDKCYENREWVWGYREDEPMGGYDPYSASKGCSELVTSAYRNSFFSGGRTRIASGRAGNVIGGGDVSRDRLIPDLVRTFRAGEATLIRNPGAVRPWQHVLEPLAGYMCLAQKLCSEGGQALADGWNFGPDSSAERTVGEVVETVCGFWGPEATWRLDTGQHVHEAGYLKLDSSKAKRLLGWSPKWDFQNAICATVEWYRAEQAGEDMLAFTKRQIRAYFDGASQLRTSDVGR